VRHWDDGYHDPEEDLPLPKLDGKNAITEENPLDIVASPVGWRRAA